jgi:hypothetical protein
MRPACGGEVAGPGMRAHANAAAEAGPALPRERACRPGWRRAGARRDVRLLGPQSGAQAAATLHPSREEGTEKQAGPGGRPPFLRGPRQMTASSGFGSMKPMLITPRFSCSQRRAEGGLPVTGLPLPGGPPPPWCGERMAPRAAERVQSARPSQPGEAPGRGRCCSRGAASAQPDGRPASRCAPSRPPCCGETTPAAQRRAARRCLAGCCPGPPARTRATSLRRTGGSPHPPAPASWAPRGRKCQCPTGPPATKESKITRCLGWSMHDSDSRSEGWMDRRCGSGPGEQRKGGSGEGTWPSPRGCAAAGQHPPPAPSPPAQRPAAPRRCSCPRHPCRRGPAGCV